MTYLPLYKSSDCLRYFFWIFLSYLFSILGTVQNATSEIPDNYTKTFEWHKRSGGLFTASYFLSNEKTVLRSEVLLVRFNLSNYHLELSLPRIPRERKFVQSSTDSAGGVVGINTSFFDPEGRPLGLLISNEKKIQPIHQGGSLLTGIFFIRSSKPYITHRSSFNATDVELAFQAGPRLIENGKPLSLLSPEVMNRRSGIALTKNGEILLFATVLRFPGASLKQIQQMLLDPKLGHITDALNLDGGGSSQFYLKELNEHKALIVSGGDPVPVALIVKERHPD